METVNDTTSGVVETAEAAPQEQTLDEAIGDLDNLTIDDLMNVSGEEFTEFATEETHKGMKPINHWLQHVPEDVRKHLANIRSDYTRKTQEIAQMRKDLEASKAEMARNQERLMNGSLAQQVANIDTETEYDLFDSEGVKNEIKRQAALMMKEMLAPAQKEIQVQQRKMALEQFKADNPEIQSVEYRNEILNLLKSRPELKLEDAFYITKAKLGAVEVERQKNQMAERKQQQRDTIKRSGTGSRNAPKGTPKFKSAWEAFQYHKAQGLK